MRSILIAVILLTAFIFSVNGQEAIQHPFAVEPQNLAINKEKSLAKKNVADFDRSIEKPKQSNQYQRPSKKERFNHYVKNTVGLQAFARAGASAGFSTITNNPEEWERTGEGFGRRFASSLGSNAIRQTVIYGLDEALELDSKYYKSKKKDFGSRMKNAVLSTVTARNKRGRRVIGVPQIAGTYSSNIISREVWYPNRFNYKDGLRSGTISLGITSAFNLVREYF